MKGEILSIVIFLSLAHGAHRLIEKPEEVVTKLVTNPRYFHDYYKCLMELAPCIPDAKLFKFTFPKILKTRCKTCTPLEKKNFKRIVEHLRNNEKEKWENLMNFYDPERVMTKDMFTDPLYVSIQI